MKTHHHHNKLIKILLTLTLICGYDYPSIGQAGFPMAYGDQVFYYPKLSAKTQDIEAIKSGLSLSLKKVVQIYDITERKIIDAKEIKNINILNDRIELETKSKKNKFICLYDVIKDSTIFFFSKQNAGYYILLPSIANFGFADFDAARQFADNIYATQYPYINKVRDSLLSVFKEKLIVFKESKKEVMISDEQKALFLLADTASTKMDYFSAIRIYIKALQIDEMAYPKAYANLALLYAQINYFDYALLCMQKYIWLETDAIVLRGAKDKMYEWEGIIYY